MAPMKPWPINNSGSRRPNLSRIDRLQTQWVEPIPSSDRSGYEVGVTLPEAFGHTRHDQTNGPNSRGVRHFRPAPMALDPGQERLAVRAAWEISPCRASTDGSRSLPHPPRPSTRRQPTRRSSASAPAATLSPTTTPAAMAGWSLKPRWRRPRPHPSSFATGSMSLGSPCVWRPSSQPSEAWSDRAVPCRWLARCWERFAAAPHRCRSPFRRPWCPLLLV